MSVPTTTVVVEAAKDVPFPGGGDLSPREGELRIAFDKKPYAEMIAHAVTDPEVELCGVLVGFVRADRHGQWLHVVDIIRGEKAEQKNAQVTFTHDTWTHINREMDRHPDRKILGWYHTHGGFGIFLSEMDTFIHENFFTEPHHFAYVYDPLAGTEGFFFREGKEFHRASRYWVGGKPREVLGARPDTRGNVPGAGPGLAGPSAGAAEVGPAFAALSRQLTTLQVELGEQRDGSFTTTLVAFLLICGGTLFLNWSIGSLVRDNLRRERVTVKVHTDPATGLQYGVELIPLPLRKAEVAAGLIIYQDRDSGQFFASDGLMPISSSALALEEHVQATLAAAHGSAPGRVPAPAPRGPTPPERAGDGPSPLVVLLAVGAVVSAFVAAGVLVKRRSGRR